MKRNPLGSLKELGIKEDFYPQPVMLDEKETGREDGGQYLKHIAPGGGIKISMGMPAENQRVDQAK